jgi:hypothetical protein
MFDPAWLSAAAETAAVVEGGVTMFNKKAGAKAAPTAPTVVVSGMTRTEFLIGVFILAIAMLGAALIVHYGLVA